MSKLVKQFVMLYVVYIWDPLIIYADPQTKPHTFHFQLCELGNFSVHIALRNLRPPGTKVRKIPVADGNPLTKLFE